MACTMSSSDLKCTSSLCTHCMLHLTSSALGRSSTAIQGDTSAILAFLLSTTVLSVGLITLTGTHRSPQSGVITLPTRICLGLALDWVGSTTTVLPTDITADSGNLPQTRCSLCGFSVTQLLTFTVPTLSGMHSPLHLSVLESSDRNWQWSSV